MKKNTDVIFKQILVFTMKNKTHLLTIFAILSGIFLIIFTPNSSCKQADIAKERQQKNVCGYDFSSGYSSLVEKILPGVVNISTTAVIDKRHFAIDDLFGSFFGRNQFFQDVPHKKKKERLSILGSGFILDKDGHIITNYHVLKDATEILITTQDQKEYKANLIGFDEASDLAVIRADIKNPKFVSFGSSNEAKIGDFVLTIGNPFGLGGTVTQGIISGKSRHISGDNPYDNFIQTDAPINHGNSGGPMFNLCGEVIGINTAIISPTGGSVGLGFAIASDFAKGIIEKLKNKEKIPRAVLGVSIRILNVDAKEALGAEGFDGVFVESIVKGGAAEKAGVKSGDIILSVNAIVIKDPSNLASYIASKKIGDKIELEILRDGKKIKITVNLVEKVDEKKINEKENVNGFGISVSELSRKIRISLRIPEEVSDGVIVTDIRNEKIIEYDVLKEYDLITHVNGVEVKSVADFDLAYKNFAKSGRKNVLFKIYRNGSWESIVLLVR